MEQNNGRHPHKNDDNNNDEDQRPNIAKSFNEDKITSAMCKLFKS